jgi:hypothetical protein
MSENTASNSPDDDFANSQHGHANNTEHVQSLTWALLDDLITEEELSELGNRLTNDEHARREYTRCVQLHADLQSAFAGPPSSIPDTTKPSKTPVLGFLKDETQSFAVPSPPAEDVTS